VAMGMKDFDWAWRTKNERTFVFHFPKLLYW
jgi:hypothetical protein